MLDLAINYSVPLDFYVSKMFLKKIKIFLIFYLLQIKIFFIFSDYFDALILKIILKK